MTGAVYFNSQLQFREWLVSNHSKATELLVGYYKKATGIPSMTWPESVDQALCFGWIDGIRRKVDDNRYTIRFTPRRPSSIWSTVNIAKMESLLKKGMVQPAGKQAYEKRSAKKSSVYSFENKPMKLTAKFERVFKSDEKAWNFFESLAPSYKRTAIYHVMSAKQETTRRRRLDKLIGWSRNGIRLR